jgi:hypothetical protein
MRTELRMRAELRILAEPSIRAELRMLGDSKHSTVTIRSMQ